jgi:tetratricopeptide (TPR) repeat protein
MNSYCRSATGFPSGAAGCQLEAPCLIANFTAKCPETRLNMRKIPAAFLFIVVLAMTVAGQKLEPPKLTPVPTTESQKQLIREGIALHDEGNYSDAISRYEQVLKENPDNVDALYELAYSSYTAKDYKRAIIVGHKAAQYRSPLLDQTYVLLGNCYDESGDPNKSVEVYKAGIKLNPSSSLLQYYLAITYLSTQHLKESKSAAKKSAGLDPNHPSSQLLLSTLFERGTYKIPSLLAALRFLVLEPNTTRSEAALERVKRIMQAGVSQGKDEKNINILVSSGQNKDEGDFGSIEMFMGLMKAASYTEKNKDKNEMQLLADNFENLFAVISESPNKGDRTKFTWTYYLPYFLELKKQGHTETFAYFINQRSNLPEVNSWLQLHQDKISNFLLWSRNYHWPKVD